MAAVARQVEDADVARGIELFSTRSQMHGGRAFNVGEVTGEADLRLYHALVNQHWILATDGGPDRRIPVDIGARLT
jgi:hypothetical protein